MVYKNLNQSRKRTLEALVTGNFEKAKKELKILTKKCYWLALATQDENLKRGLVYEGDIYFNIAKNLMEKVNDGEETDNNLDKKEDNLSKKLKLKKPPKKWTPEPKSNISFEDVIGLEAAKKEIQLRMIVPYTNAKVAKSYGLNVGGGMLLYGPPGTGKTSLARAVAGELDIPFFNLNSADIIERTAEKTIENIRSIFEEAKKYKRSVMFFDEIELIVPLRPTSRTMKQTVNEFLIGLDDVYSKKDGLLFMGATNRPWEIRPAILRPGRLSEKIYIEFPDKQGREGIFKLNLDALNISEDIDYDSLAETTVGYSGADIEYACEKAGRRCLEYFTKTGEQKSIQMLDFQKVLHEIVPTSKRMNPYDLKKLEEFRQEIKN